MVSLRGSLSAGGAVAELRLELDASRAAAAEARARCAALEAMAASLRAELAGTATALDDAHALTAAARLAATPQPAPSPLWLRVAAPSSEAASSPRSLASLEHAEAPGESADRFAGAPPSRRAGAPPPVAVSPAAGASGLAAFMFARGSPSAPGSTPSSPGGSPRSVASFEGGGGAAMAARLAAELQAEKTERKREAAAAEAAARLLGAEVASLQRQLDEARKQLADRPQRPAPAAGTEAATQLAAGVEGMLAVLGSASGGGSGSAQQQQQQQQQQAAAAAAEEAEASGGVVDDLRVRATRLLVAVRVANDAAAAREAEIMAQLTAARAEIAALRRADMQAAAAEDEGEAVPAWAAAALAEAAASGAREASPPPWVAALLAETDAQPAAMPLAAEMVTPPSAAASTRRP